METESETMETKSRLQFRSSRRLFVAAIPGLALAAAACSSDDDAADTKVVPRPTPATPDEALEVLLEGNKRFAANTPEALSAATREVARASNAEGQAPFATVLACADSRVASEMIFDQFLGDIFVVREAGNIAQSPTNLGSLEFGHAALGSNLLVVCGHSSCGAVDAAFTGAEPGGNIQSIVDAIQPGIGGASSLDEAVAMNVDAVIEQIRNGSEILRSAEEEGELKIVGAIFDLETGVVSLI